MPENAGLYQKFWVRRVDGRDLPGGDRQGAAYFVLDVVNDPFARQALMACWSACRWDLPELAAGLDALLRELEAGVKDGPAVKALREPKHDA